MKLLAVIDMHNDFVTGSLGTPEAAAIVSAVREKVAQAIQNGDEVAFTKDTHGPDYLETPEGRKLPVAHCIRGSDGWEIVDALEEFTHGRHAFEKETFGCRELARWANGRSFDAVEVVGLCTDICVISNALMLKAALPRAEITVDSRCCAGTTPESHQRALEAMAVCQINIL